MDVSELGEFGLIQRLAAAIGRKPPKDLVVGIGDDAAVWRTGDQYVVATTDTLVEGVHFLPGVMPWSDIGWKALAVNVSDIAAMGGKPQFALVTLALPQTTPVESVDALYGGLRECAEEYAVAIAGGDIVSAPEVSITVALIGRAQVQSGEPLLLLRNAARPGDAIAVTGTLGDSAAGLRRLREGASAADELARAHLRPRPPLGLAQEAVRVGIRCAIDVSDGLLQDIGHICEMSDLGAVVAADTLLMSNALRTAYPEDALRLACTGGEDYELILTGPRPTIERLQGPPPISLTVIGEIVEDAGQRVRLIDPSGNEIDFGPAGWDHLRAAAPQHRR